jgi:hypothetical protein
MKLWPVFFVLANALAAASPPPGVSPPKFVEIDPEAAELDRDAIGHSHLEGTWSAELPAKPFTFQIEVVNPHGLRLRMLTNAECKWLPITLGSEWWAPPDPQGKQAIEKIQINIDGDRKPDNCVSLPTWITFDFGSPAPTRTQAKVTVREQFPEGPDETEFYMVRRLPEG